MVKSKCLLIKIVGINLFQSLDCPQMPTTAYTVICTQNKQIADGVHEIRLSKPAGFRFSAGQFVLFQVPDSSNPADFQPRAYSIASAPEENELKFCVRIVEAPLVIPKLTQASVAVASPTFFIVAVTVTGWLSFTLEVL